MVRNVEVRLISAEKYFIWRTLGKTVLDSKRNEVNRELQIPQITQFWGAI
jgi:hypothetical protein